MGRKNGESKQMLFKRACHCFLALFVLVGVTAGVGLSAFAEEADWVLSGEGDISILSYTPPIVTDELLADLEFTTLELQEISISDLQLALEAGDTTSQEVVSMYLDRIAAYDRPLALNAVILVNPRALEIAAALDAERAAGHVRGPLHGIPIVIKDNYDYDGMPTSAGSKVLQDSYPSNSAFTVQRLVDAGAIVIAKANLSEFANSRTTSQSSLGGTAHNPYAVSASGLANRASGGSSGGSGVSVAANFALASMGTDTGGSIRSPGHANGLFALKPTWGVTSREGVIPLVLARDVTGPLARTATDIAYMMDAIVGTDVQDDITLTADSRIPDTYVDYLNADALADARIAWLPASKWTRPASGATLEAWLASNPVHEQWQTDMEAAGATFLSIDFPYTTYYNTLYKNPATPDAPNFNTGWGPIDIEQYFRALPTTDEMAARGITEAVGRFGVNPVHSQIDIRDLGVYASNGTGDYMISSITTNANNIEAGNPDYNWEAGYRVRTDNGWRIFLANRALYQAALALYLDAYDADCFAYYMWRGPATTSGTAGDNANYLQNIVSHGGFPDLVVPIGATDGTNASYPAGMPICVDLVGRAWDEGALIEIAYAYEQAYTKRVDSRYTVPLVDEKVLLKLTQLIDAIDGLDLTLFSADSVAALTVVLDAAKALDGDSSAQEYYDALFALAGAYDALLPDTNKTLLSATIAVAAGLIEDGTVDLLIDTVRLGFLEAYETALAIEADPYASQDEIDEATITLMDSIHKAGFLKGDKEELAHLVELCAGENLDNFVEAGKAAFIEALAAAEALLADGDAMDAEIEAAWDALFEAWANLRLYADKSLLSATYALCAALDTTPYTAQSVAPFRAALNNAASVLQDNTLSQDDQSIVNAAVTALNTTRSNLQLAQQPPADPPTNPPANPPVVEQQGGGNGGTPLAPLPLTGVSDWAQKEVDALNARGVIPEALKSEFQKTIRRDEFTALLVNVYEYVKGPVTGYSSPFTDIADSAYKVAIEKAYTVKLVDGTGPQSFTPDGLLTREETAKLLGTVVAQINGTTIPATGTPNFVDSAAIAGWAVPYVAYVQTNKIMLGDNNDVTLSKFEPQGTLTREMAFLTAERLIVQYDWKAI
ncbi:MAG: S-layer homology domain-containing protein [Oscillospiraceae bacterium]|jgi:Asp-tRNA(Asn)/Glu-tRNA(Gln) amidotransferase A subunit family amidase|nr:S-layer homology domain-containing protein [Oscillospiraceae bacterium]